MNIQKLFVSKPRYKLGTKLDMLGGPYERNDVAPRFVCTGTDVMIFKIFSPKNLAKNWRF
jgi:hypothetical protein